jgi:hypothetical protein
MLRVGFKPMISVFERAKIVHALDSAATVIGSIRMYSRQSIESGRILRLRYLEFVECDSNYFVTSP